MDILSSLSATLNYSLLAKEVFVVLFVSKSTLVEGNNFKQLVGQLQSLLDIACILNSQYCAENGLKLDIPCLKVEKAKYSRISWRETVLFDSSSNLFNASPIQRTVW